MTNFTPFGDDDAREIDEALRYQAEMQNLRLPARRDTAPLSPAMASEAALAAVIETAQQTLKIMQQQAALAAVVSDQADRLDRIEMVAAQSRDWMELLGFVARYKVSPIDTDDRSMALLGKKVRDWHIKLHLDFKQGEAFHKRYGGVNLWQVRHLYRYFMDSGYTLDEERYRADIAQSGRGQ